VRVPLDYYRILGLPIQATAEQLRQAHRDRALQLPRREYSEAAITARKELLDEACAVLSDPEQRQIYDASFLTKTYESDTDTTADRVIEEGALVSDPAIDPYTPSIDIDNNQLVGALLILLELGEYELVLKLGRPYLAGGNQSLYGGRFIQPDIVRSDIVLTVAFACLELGREQWQQTLYENAAESLETGQELLLREGLFASIRGEMQADLFKLRPYRILELLALPENNDSDRHKGLALLQDMLQDRGGIDGTGDDRSGLNVDDFLRFIQQLRSYLTATEQQSLFEAEARRPSAVATYLAVYALLAKGFAEKQPALVRRAKLMLIRLGTRQDVHLEQAICALLLGQTEEASRALERSQEYDSIAFIREHSQGSPDLLPGLCLYAERWLQNEVFPHFRDLAKQQAALKDYFANDHVQAYLEELPNEPEAVNQWATLQPSGIANGRSSHSSDPGSRPTARTFAHAGQSRGGTAAPVTPTFETESSASMGSTGMPAAERVSQQSLEEQANGGASMPTTGGRSPRSPQAYSDRKRSQGTTNLRPPHAELHAEPMPIRRSNSRRRTPRLDRLVFLFTIGFLGVGTLIFVGSKLTQAAAGGSAPVENLQPRIAPAVQAVAQPLLNRAPNTILTKEKAKEIIEIWYDAKASAFGENHETDKLSQILAEPALSERIEDAEQLNRANSYYKYEHNVEVLSVTTDSEAGAESVPLDIREDAEQTGEQTTEPTAEQTEVGAEENLAESEAEVEATSEETQIEAETPTQTQPSQAQIEAEVVETAQFYSDGELNLSESYDSTLQVRYDLVFQNNRWLIENISVLR
jgi:hypothetical protein